MSEATDWHGMVATSVRDQLLALYPSETVLTVLALALGNVIGNVVADDKLDELTIEVGLAMRREAQSTMERRDMARADTAGRQ